MNSRIIVISLCENKLAKVAETLSSVVDLVLVIDQRAHMLVGLAFIAVLFL